MAWWKRSQPPPALTEPEGDEIDVSNRGDQSAIAAGRNARAWVVNIRDLKWQPVVAVLILVGTLLGAILYFVVPRAASEMNGQFNVAVAEFSVQNANGSRIRSKDGQYLADYVRQQIDSQFEQIRLNETVPYEIWGPDQTGIINGQTEEARSAEAKALAKRIHAHVLIYGVIVSDGNNSKFSPEFYINHASFTDASEITGEHELGSELKVDLPFNDSIQAIRNPALAGRVNALDLITIGLAYYSVDDFKQALSYFEKAAAEKRWISQGREVVYLLIGNAYVRQASKVHDFSDLSLATRNYQEALDANGNYGRAMIGKANVLYLAASLDKNNCESSGLDEAASLLDQAMSLKEQPLGANIDTKVHFYRGQIDIIRDACHLEGKDWLAQAQNEFNWVTNQYETRKQKNEDFEGIEPFVSHAYARLGYIAYQRGGGSRAAIPWFKKAVAIASPYYQGLYTSMMGDIYAATEQKEAAIQAYEDAIAIAEANADPASVSEYKAKLETIQSQ
jgi:tetratricopeptide (TPR) repeat protein